MATSMIWSRELVLTVSHPLVRKLGIYSLFAAGGGAAAAGRPGGLCRPAAAADVAGVARRRAAAAVDANSAAAVIAGRGAPHLPVPHFLTASCFDLLPCAAIECAHKVHQMQRQAEMTLGSRHMQLLARATDRLVRTAGSANLLCLGFRKVGTAALAPPRSVDTSYPTKTLHLKLRAYSCGVPIREGNGS